MVKFDVVVGNPPYQEDVSVNDTNNGQKRVRSIFHLFQIEADKIATSNTVLIYPGGRWLHRSGKGMSKFGLSQINDTHLSKVMYYPLSSDVFAGVSIGDGLTIVCKDFTKEKDYFDYEYITSGNVTSVQLAHPGEKIIPLNPDDINISIKLDEFVSEHQLEYLHKFIYPQKLFGVESSFVENNLDKVVDYEGGDYDEKNFIKLLANDKAGKSGRSKWYLTHATNIPKNKQLIYEWQVTVSSANAGGQKRDNQLSIADNNTAFARSRLALRSFQTKTEADNFYKFVDSKIIRYAFLLSDENLSSLGKTVPDVLDYTNANPLINFDESIDEQLQKLLGLTNDEMSHIETTIANKR